MKRVLLIVVLLALVAGAVAGAAAFTAAPPPSNPAPAAVAAPATAPNANCNFVLVGKNASADGSVLMGYNNDWSATTTTTCRSCPATRRTTSTSSCSPSAASRGRHQRQAVRRLYGTATTLDKTVLAADPYVQQGQRRRDLGRAPAAVQHLPAGARPARSSGRRPASRAARPAASASPTRTRPGCSSCSAATTGWPRACPTTPTSRIRTW